MRLTTLLLPAAVAVVDILATLPALAAAVEDTYLDQMQLLLVLHMP
jgi:hypothetical protein